ncbi:transposase [Desulfoferrobacter suflitae]|uniref:transposase n=1 Tax=Desulfoferrobacter suflitae TaxID=2865782 RepID=UPI00338F029B
MAGAPADYWFDRRDVSSDETSGRNCLTAEEFIAAITQHIPDKHFQMVRYYGRPRGISACRHCACNCDYSTGLVFE